LPGHHHQRTGPFNLGFRFDVYRGITSATSRSRARHRVQHQATNTVLRISYARTLETPFNENLVLAAWDATIPVINALM
jgi:hypothetical protein